MLVFTIDIKISKSVERNSIVHHLRRNFNAMSLERSSLSPTGVLLRLGPGGTWGEVLELAPPSRYSYPHGQCRSVGVGGYLLGGGVNWLGTYNKVSSCPAPSC